ncbi:MAG TPA: nuclear transport factor 2 family protein [Mycobacterium sp.]|nr:nuclear transport factor 2 family protein [Mycobacterium sp.]
MTVEERLALLEQRLRRAEDELAIARLMASYGPLVDAGDADAVAGLWSEHGEYDVDGWHMRSRADVAEMVRSPAHQGLIGGGCAHFLGPVHVDVDGDDAVAVCESIVVRRNEDGGGYRVWRASANHVALRRTAVGWQIVKRTTRALDGSAAARELLASGTRRK